MSLGSHFVLTTFGSLGDLHPYIAVGIGLRGRGHRVTIATSEVYRSKVEGEGLGFRPLRPDAGQLLADPDLFRKAFHPRTGSEFIFKRLLMPVVEQSYHDTLEAIRDADLVVGHPATFATPTAAQTLGKRWISVALQPVIFLSATDPPAISGVPLLQACLSLGPWFWGPFLQIARSVGRGWGAPLNELRRKSGFRELRDPCFDDMFSPFGTQCWFSKVLAKPQEDWPAKTTITGFPFYDRLEPGQEMDAGLAQFLDSGAPPVVFTLGSSAVMDAGSFYRESVAAVRRLGIRAVLLVGRDPRNRPAEELPDSIFVAEYAPYSALLPRAAATVHQGGVGTTAQALQAGRPMIVVPWAHDQPDNALRVARLGSGRVIARGSYRARRVERELGELLSKPQYALAARAAAEVMRAEDGVAAACDGLEQALLGD